MRLFVTNGQTITHSPKAGIRAGAYQQKTFPCVLGSKPLMNTATVAYFYLDTAFVTQCLHLDRCGGSTLYRKSVLIKPDFQVFPV